MNIEVQPSNYRRLKVLLEKMNELIPANEGHFDVNNGRGDNQGQLVVVAYGTADKHFQSLEVLEELRDTLNLNTPIDTKTDHDTVIGSYMVIDPATVSTNTLQQLEQKVNTAYRTRPQTDRALY